jgi:hypothetical protein
MGEEEKKKKNLEEEEEEEEDKEYVETILSDLRRLAYDGDLKLMLKVIPYVAKYLVKREDEILQVLLIGMIFWRLRKKINEETEITAYDFKTMFESIKDVMEKINEKKKEIEQNQQIKKPKYPVSLFGMKVRIEGNRFVLEGEEKEKEFVQ